MEYVDGEDLASLLRRIGRIPQDKAIDLARQLCAGPAAAHERGVLHRDLKTDIYALGLVLFEIFTGKRAYDAKTLADLVKQHEGGSLTTPSSVVRDLDPAVERIILRCLERDPARRPASALAVAAALPGANPLADALAVGETPSPDLLVAAVLSVAARVDSGLRATRQTDRCPGRSCAADARVARLRRCAGRRRARVSGPRRLHALGADAPRRGLVGHAAIGNAVGAVVLVPDESPADRAHSRRRHGLDERSTAARLGHDAGAARSVSE